MEGYRETLTDIEQKADALSQRLIAEGKKRQTEGDEEKVEKILDGYLQDVCRLVRLATADDSVAAEMHLISAEASRLVEKLVNMAYDDHELYDFVPSYAHADEFAPLVRDPTAGKNFQGPLFNNDAFMNFIHVALQYRDNPNLDKSNLKAAMSTIAVNDFNATPKPHPHTSPLARFRTEHPVPSVSASSPSAQAVLYGCCSIMSDSIHSPIRLLTVPNSDILLFTGAGGYKNRDPSVSFHHLDSSTTYGEMPMDHDLNTGLLGIAYDIALDPTRKLIYAADEDRIKSFVYGAKDEILAKHTLKCTRNGVGPLALVDNGARILRAGRGGVDVWEINDLPTHGSEGSTRIGKGKVNTEDTWRDFDSDEDVELSTGTLCHSSIEFSDSDAAISSMTPQTMHIPAQWATSSTLKALCFPKKTWSTIFAMDLAGGGGKVASRYLGHAGEVFTITSSADDPNSFVTSCGDGVVRLFDVREPLPKLSIDAGEQCQHIYSSLYVHIDGVPVIFTGGNRNETVKIWDVRAKKLAYELATGNNEVVSMAWDAERCTLYAATECERMDRLGYHHDYKQAKIKYDEGIWDRRGEAPKRDNSAVTDEKGEREKKRRKITKGDPRYGMIAEEPDSDGEAKDDDDVDDDEGTDPDEYGEEKCWPEHCSHDERYLDTLGILVTMYFVQYRFGLDADSTIVPAYGNARSGDEYSW